MLHQSKLTRHMKLKEGFGNIDENEILNFEKIIGEQLPLEYRTFLKENNGGRPKPNIFKTLKGDYETDIQFFFGITSGNYDLEENFNRLKNIISIDYIPIAIDSGGNFVLLNLNTREIYFLDWNNKEKYLVTDTFKSFINELYNLKKEVTELDKAINSQNIFYFESLLEKGKQIDSIVNKFNQSIVVIASLKGKYKLLKFFIENGAKYEKALFNACSNGHFEIVKYLLSKGVNPNERDIEQNNDTCLIQACYGGYLEIVKLLLKNGADINAKDINGQSALNKAYWSDNQELIDYLEKEFPPAGPSIR